MTTAFFIGGLEDIESRPGFQWGHNTPYIKPSWFEVARPSIGLLPGNAKIYRTATVATYDSRDIDSRFLFGR